VDVPSTISGDDKKRDRGATTASNGRGTRLARLGSCGGGTSGGSTSGGGTCGGGTCGGGSCGGC